LHDTVGLCEVRANAAHIRQPGPNSGLGFLVKALKTFNVVPLSSGPHATRCGAKREQLEWVKGFRTGNGASQGQNLVLTVLYVPSQGHNLALTVLYVPRPGSGLGCFICAMRIGGGHHGDGLGLWGFWGYNPV